MDVYGDAFRRRSEVRVDSNLMFEWIMSEIQSGADKCAELLKNLEIKLIFCITGAGNLALVDAIHRLNYTEIIYSHHEQAAVMEAQGYSRISGKPAVALVTTGGGAANSITGILSAHLDSIPILIIAGNESSFHCENMTNFRAFGVQGFDAVSVAAPITKSAVRVKSVGEIEKIFRDGIRKTSEGRRGPVLIDFPMDIQRAPVVDETLMQSEPYETPRNKNSLAVYAKRCADDFLSSHQPIFYFGNGLRGGEAIRIARRIIDKFKCPFFLTWSAIDLIEDSHPQNCGRVGLYGDRASNIILQKSDLIINVGTRLAIPQIGYDKKDFGRNASKWVIDIDPIELSKFDGVNWNIYESNAEDFLVALEMELMKATAQDVPDLSLWNEDVQRIWSKLPRENQIGPGVTKGDGYVHSASVISFLNDNLPNNATIVTDVGAGLLTGHYMTRIKHGQRLFTSQGLGEMGFGLPGAIGAYFADKTRPLICLNTDGGIMFNLQELQVVAHHDIPIKLFIFNNDGYGMIRISQDNLFESRYIGSNSDSGVSCPDFGKLAATFKLRHVLIDNEEQFESSMKQSIESTEGVLIEIRMSPSQKYLPRLSTSKTPNGVLVSPPIEDLDPLIPIELLEELLGYKARPESYTARGLNYE
jgi:acetolactate synthase-1/2/3 large subunit